MIESKLAAGREARLRGFGTRSFEGLRVYQASAMRSVIKGNSRNDLFVRYV